MQFRTLTDDELLLHVDNLPDSLASPLVRELASRLRDQRDGTDDRVLDLEREVEVLQSKVDDLETRVEINRLSRT